MPTPRRQQFDSSKPVWIHAISRCVRRAFLCGENADGRSVEHRKTCVGNSWPCTLLVMTTGYVKPNRFNPHQNPCPSSRLPSPSAGYRLSE